MVFDQPCLEDLERWLEVRARWSPGCDNVFIAMHGGPLASETIWGILKDSCRRAGIRQEVWTHLFRHTAITRLLEGGMNLQDVAAFAGHSSVNTTLMYFHKGPGELKAAYDDATKKRS